ncbi:Bacterial Ig-like domain (group 2) [compost metagenome]
MATKKVAWNATTRTATVLTEAASLPGGSESLGTFTHPDPTDQLSRNEYSHVVWHHVRDLLYKVKGWQDMQVVKLVDTTVVKATSITVAPATVLIGVGTTKQLTVTVAPATTTDNRVTYTVDNTDIVTVDANGLVLGRKVGETKIHVRTADGSQLLKSVPVTAVAQLVPVASITLAPATVTLTVAAPTQQLTATVLPADATEKGITWTSSAPAIATVSATGLVTRVANGSAVITATAKDGSGKTATRNVTVTA